MPRLISEIGADLVKKLTIFAVGALGIVVPLMVILGVAVYIVYGPPGDYTIWALVVSIFFVVLVVVAVAIGATKKVLSGRIYGYRATGCRLCFDACSCCVG